MRVQCIDHTFASNWDRASCWWDIKTMLRVMGMIYEKFSPSCIIKSCWRTPGFETWRWRNHSCSLKFTFRWFAPLASLVSRIITQCFRENDMLSVKIEWRNRHVSRLEICRGIFWDFDESRARWRIGVSSVQGYVCLEKCFLFFSRGCFSSYAKLSAETRFLCERFCLTGDDRKREEESWTYRLSMSIPLDTPFALQRKFTRVE